MKWLITGGTGQLARSLTDLLDRESINFVSLSRSDLDISEDEAAEEIITYKPTIIINCAAYTNVDRAEVEKEKALWVNKIGARNVALAAKRSGVPLVHISSDYVFRAIKSHHG